MRACKLTARESFTEARRSRAMGDERATRLHVRRPPCRDVVPQSRDGRSPTPISSPSPASPATTRSCTRATCTRRTASSGAASRTECSGSRTRTDSMWARTGELRETAIAFLGIGDWKFVGPDLRRRHDLRELPDRRASRQQVEADAGDCDIRRRARRTRTAASCSGAQGAAGVEGAVDCGRGVERAFASPKA